jgi:hypothetical protein
MSLIPTNVCRSLLAAVVLLGCGGHEDIDVTVAQEGSETRFVWEEWVAHELKVYACDSCSVGDACEAGSYDAEIWTVVSSADMCAPAAIRSPVTFGVVPDGAELGFGTMAGTLEPAHVYAVEVTVGLPCEGDVRDTEAYGCTYFAR